MTTTDLLKLLAKALPLNRDVTKTCYAITNEMRDAIHEAIAAEEAQGVFTAVPRDGTEPLMGAALLEEEQTVDPSPGDRSYLICRLKQEACGGSNFNALLLAAADMLAADAKQRDVLLDHLHNILDAKEVMRAAGINQADFPTMFKEFAQQVAVAQEDLVMLVWRLAANLKRVKPGSESAQQAINFINAKGLTPSLLRTPAAPQPPQATAKGDAHQIWAATQLAHGEGIEDGVARVPMTRDQVDELAEDGCFLGNVYEITEAVEQFHGIGVKS